MMLWTWQGLDYDPMVQAINRSKSEFFNSPPFPDLPRTYEELDELLSLPSETRHQYLWCYTSDSWPLHPWYERCLWPLDVPQSQIISLIDSPLWEYLIGSPSVPIALHAEWRDELRSKRLNDDEYRTEMVKKERAYRQTFPSRATCWQRLRSPTICGPDVLALVPTPLDVAWIRAYDLTPRFPQLVMGRRIRRQVGGPA